MAVVPLGVPNLADSSVLICYLVVGSVVGGFEDGKHPAVLLIRRDRKTDKPILSVVGNPEESISFDFGAEEVESPLAAIIAFPPRK